MLVALKAFRYSKVDKEYLEGKTENWKETNPKLKFQLSGSVLALIVPEEENNNIVSEVIINRLTILILSKEINKNYLYF